MVFMAQIIALFFFQNNENHNHLFFDCSHSEEIWWKVCDRCDIPRMRKSYDDWIKWATLIWKGITDVNLVITWSRNPHAKTPIPGKPSKSGLIGVWHKDNLYLGTSTIGNRNPHPTNIDSRMRSIRMTSWR